MNNDLKNKKFASIVHRVVLLPLLLMSVIGLISVIACIATLYSVNRDLIRTYRNSVQISQNQLDNLTGQIDSRVIRYWADNSTHQVLNNCRSGQPVEEYAVFLANNRIWMQDLVNEYDLVSGCYSYYENIDSYRFQGSMDLAFDEYVRNYTAGPDPVYNCWHLVEVGGRQYLMNMKHYQHHYCCVWMRVEDVCRQMGLTREAFGARVYLINFDGTTTLSEQESLKLERHTATAIEADKEDAGIRLGVYITREELLSAIPWPFYLLLVITALSICMIPFMIIWLRRRISRPIYRIDRAMQMISSGNVDYRIPIGEGKTFDEFDRLSVRINETLDELEEISYNLYQTEIRAQQNRITYLMNQIRPHFILNALNIIYTCDITEYDTIKKMVLYLTEYFRYIVNVRRNFVPLADEFHHVENYLNIQKERYRNRFDTIVEWEIETEKLLIPPLVVQTFAENCIKHGLKDGGKTLIYIIAKKKGDRLQITVSDTGNGFPEEILEAFETFKRTGDHQELLGVGIENVAEGLKILYKEEKPELSLENLPSGGATVKICLPAWDHET